MPLTPWFAVKALGCLAAVAIVAFSRISSVNHRFPPFGGANYVTAARAAIVAVVVAYVGESADIRIEWLAAGAATAGTMLDGVDGWLARRSGMSSAFGARFDMEVDALLIMALSALAWTHGKAGVWALLSGLLR